MSHCCFADGFLTKHRQTTLVITTFDKNWYRILYFVANNHFMLRPYITKITELFALPDTIALA